MFELKSSMKALEMPPKIVPTNILKSKIFSKAVACAKGYAKALGRDQLTPLLLAGGLLRLLPDFQDSLTDEDQNNISALQKAWQSSADALQMDVNPIDNEKMQLSVSLKKILGEPPKDMSGLISALSSSLMPPSITSSPILSRIMSYASAIAFSQNKDQISTEIFATATYMACLNDELDGLPGLTTYLIANRDACEALLRKFKSDMPIRKPGELIERGLSDDLQEALKAQDPEPERLRNAVNLGLKIGVQLAAELAVAYHEAGHAIVSAILRPSLTVTKITIVPDPKEGADGVTYYDSSSVYWERSQTQEAFQAQMCVALAGRAAQLIKFGSTQIDAGSSSDIESATDVAWRGITELGLDPEVGPVNLTALSKTASVTSGWIFDLAQRRLRITLRNAADRAESILRANWEALERTVSELLEKKTIDDASFLSVRALRTIEGRAGVRKAVSRPIERSIVFARTPGVLETAEGPVRYREGDGIVTGDRGEKWPVSRDYVQKTYVPSDGTEFGSDGLYNKVARKVNAMQLSEKSLVDLKDWRGVLSGSPGDWIVEYDSGDLAIVSKTNFETIYELIP